ncbi:MAG: HAD-IA family hydrolase, partial [Candidatus Diapherotrites archaeon]|nr:HAD-IA family hydrolase [Candidatus Diapherotrites archaeon]
MDKGEIKGFVFDVGGVFRDSSKSLNFSFKKAFAANGLPFPFSVKETWLLQGFDEFNSFYQINKALLAALRAKASVAKILEEADPVKAMLKIIEENISQKDEKILREMEEVTHIVFATEAPKFIKLFPRVKEAIQLLRSKNFPLSVVTVPRTDFSIKWLQENIGDYFSPVFGSDKYKDKTEAIQRCCAAFNLQPKQVAMVGDTTTDLRNGRKAATKTVALLCGMGTGKFLRKEKPDFV